MLDGPDATHIVLENGPTWLRHDVVVPLGAVADVTTDHVILRLTKDQVMDLPQIRVHRWDHGQSDLA